MHIFENIPEELVYLIYQYLHIHEIAQISKIFKLYVDYQKVFIIKYPKTYPKLKEYIHDDYHYLVELDKINFKDSFLAILGRSQNGSTREKSKILELLYKIKLKDEYPQLFPILEKLPEDKFKYEFIHDTVSELNDYDDDTSYLKRIILYNFEGELDYDKISSEFNENSYLDKYDYIYIFIIIHKFYIENVRKIDPIDDIIIKEFNNRIYLECIIDAFEDYSLDLFNYKVLNILFNIRRKGKL
jgi:hypothetical protein